MKKEVTTLTEKEQFIQVYLNINDPVKTIFLLKNRIEVVDVLDHHTIFSSSKFIHALNESLLVARRATYKSSKVFMKEYWYQRENRLKEVLHESYPTHQKYIVSGDEIAIFVPEEKGTLILQKNIKELIKK